MTQIKNLVNGCTEYMGSFFIEDCVPVSLNNQKTISPQSARHVFPSEFSLSLTEFAFFIAEPSLVIAESSLVMTEPSAFMADPFSLSLIFNMFNGLRPISSTESPKK